MAGNSPSEAEDAFLDPLRAALSCVTVAPLLLGEYAEGFDGTRVVVLNSGSPTVLDGGIEINVAIHYEVIEEDGERGPWRTSTRAYYYDIDSAEEDAGILSYHWHPESKTMGGLPHAHIGDDDLKLPPLGGRPILTGRVSTEMFVRQLIEQFKVTAHRPDWAPILAQSQAAFEQWRTWP